MVVQLVALRRLGTEQGAAGGDQVGTLEEVLLVDQEVLLLRADGRVDVPAGLVAEQPQRLDRRGRERVHRTQQRDLAVQGLAGPRRERGRDAEQGPVRVLEDEGRAGRVPGGVAASLEGRPQATGREGGGVGLTLDQLLAGEAGQHLASAGGLEEGVVLLRGRTGQRLEHVGVVGGAVFQRPRHHRLGDRVGQGGVEALAAVDGVLQLVEVLGREPFLLLGHVEDVDPEGFVLGKGQVECAQGLAVGAPLRCGHVLLADTSHRLVSPSLGGAPACRARGFPGLTPLS